MNFLINLLYHLGTVGILFFRRLVRDAGRTEIGTVVAFISGLRSGRNCQDCILALTGTTAPPGG